MESEKGGYTMYTSEDWLDSCHTNRLGEEKVNCSTCIFCVQEGRECKYLKISEENLLDLKSMACAYWVETTTLRRELAKHWPMFQIKNKRRGLYENNYNTKW